MRIGETAADGFKSYAEHQEKDLSSIKDELNVVLRELQKKIVVVIDDIDRLNKTEIRQIFQLVKSLADFKNTIYVLAFDKDVVISALAKVQEGDGRQYLEKVVQVPFTLPEVSSYEVRKFLCSSLDEVIKDLPEERWDSMYWTNIFHSGIHAFFKTIRDVNRFMNVFRFQYSLLKDNVNTIDLIAVTAIQVFLPDLHAGIKDNKSLFVKGASGYDYGHDKPDELRTTFDTIIEQTVGSGYREMVVDLLRQLFPRIESFCKNHFFSSDFDPEWRRQGRVCSDDNFDMYFQFTLSPTAISKSEIETIVASAKDSAVFRDGLKELQREGRISPFLERLLDYSKEIDKEDASRIVAALIDMGDTFPPNDEEWLGFDNITRIGRVNHWLLKEFKDQDKCFGIVKNAIERAKDSIETVVDAVVWLGWDHGKGTKHGPKSPEEQKVNEAQLSELEGIASARIAAWAGDGRLIKHRSLMRILYRWEDWADKRVVQEFVRKATEKGDGLIAFIEKTVRPVRSQSMGDYGYRTEYEVNLDTIWHFIELEETIQRLREIKSGDGFNGLNNDQRRAIDLVLDKKDGKVKPRGG